MGLQLSIDVWRDSSHGAVVQIFQAGMRIDRVTVIAGDCLDIELEPGQTFSVFPDESELAHG